MTSTNPPRVPLRVTLDPHIDRQLREACGFDDVAAGVYLDGVLLRHRHIWQRSLSKLEQAGWTGDEVSAVHEALRQTHFLEACEAEDLAVELDLTGLTALSRRVIRQPATAGFLVAVLLELRAANPACARAVSLMLPTRESRWQRAWRRFSAFFTG
jgi:hypothetical protein